MRARLRIVLLTLAARPRLRRGARDHQRPIPRPTPEPTHSLLGSYLAGHFARNGNDTTNAAAFYRSALTLDPDNEVLLEQAFQIGGLRGALGPRRAARRGSRRQGSEPPHGSPRRSASTASRAGDYASADKHFEAAERRPDRRADERAGPRLDRARRRRARQGAEAPRRCPSRPNGRSSISTTTRR